MRSGSIKVVGIMGNPIHTSLSPAMHAAAFAAQGLDDWVYLPFLVETARLPAAVEAIRALNLVGMNVTMPFKADVIRFLDEVDEEAMMIESVNTIHHRRGILAGCSTDGRGFLASLEDLGISTAGTSVVILGAGGASRAVAHALAKAGVRQITFINRTGAKVQSFAARLKKAEPRLEVEAISFGGEATGPVRAADIVVNATPLGKESLDGLRFLVDGIGTDQVVYDLSTVSPLSALLVAAQQRGCRVFGGLGMLVHQGALSYKIWTGLDAPIEAMKRAVGLEAGAGEKR